MKNKKLILAVAAFAAVIALLLGVWFVTRPETSEGEKTITITVIHSDGSSKTFTCHTDERYLAEVLLAENIAQGDQTQYGLTIHTVDGEKATWEEHKAYWAVFIGEEYALTGASEIPVNDGDTFKLVYTLG